MDILHDRLTRLLITLETLSPTARRDLLVQEVIETGGAWPAISPAPFEFWLHGIVGRGATMADAVADWQRSARARCPAFSAEAL